MFFQQGFFGASRAFIFIILPLDTCSYFVDDPILNHLYVTTYSIPCMNYWKNLECQQSKVLEDTGVNAMYTLYAVSSICKVWVTYQNTRKCFSYIKPEFVPTKYCVASRYDTKVLRESSKHFVNCFDDFCNVHSIEIFTLYFCLFFY